MLITEKVQIDPTAKGNLYGIPLENYDSMINFSGGQIVVSKPEKHVRLINISRNGYQKGFYLKQSFSVGPFQILKALLRGRKPRIMAERELMLLRLLKGQGVPVMHPVAWGVKRFMGIPLSGFLIVEEVKGKGFVEVYRALDNFGRRRLMRAYGSLIGFMHRKGLNSIVRVTDMICVSQDFFDFKRSLVVIDREWGALRRKKISYKERCQQLGKMLAKMQRWIGLPTNRETLSFIIGYIRESRNLPYSVPQILERSSFYALKSIKSKARYNQIREWSKKCGNKNVK